MKKILSILALVTVLTISFGTSSTFAAYGYGDTMENPMELWNPYTTNSNSVSLPIDSPYDNDWYLVNNSYGYESIWFSVMVYPPSGIDLQFQLVRVDANGNFTISYNNYGGPGELEGVGTGVQPGERVYIRVMSVGVKDYDTNNPYTLDFYKY